MLNDVMDGRLAEVDHSPTVRIFTLPSIAVQDELFIQGIEDTGGQTRAEEQFPHQDKQRNRYECKYGDARFRIDQHLRNAGKTTDPEGLRRLSKFRINLEKFQQIQFFRRLLRIH